MSDTAAASLRLLTEVEAKEMLESAGIPVAKTRLATTPDEAAKVAAELGYPIVMKIVSPDIAHKSDVGGVRLNIGSEAAVRSEYDAMMADVRRAQPGATIIGAAIQHMAPQGTEVIVGMTTDAQFGPVLMFGLGGIFVEVLEDVAFRIVPLERRDARQMIHEIRGYPVLDGVRGQDPADKTALEDLLLQLSAFIEAHPEITELDLNPVFAYKKGALAVDARIVVRS